MVTNRLQESSSPKQAPVAADSTNGTLLHSQVQCGHGCHPPAMADGENAVGPLALTLGAASGATDEACRSFCTRKDTDALAPVPAMLPSVLRGSRYLRPAQELLRDAVSVGGEVVIGEESAGGNYDDEVGDDAHQEMLATSRRLRGKNDDAVQAKLLSLLCEVRTIPLQNH